MKCLVVLAHPLEDSLCSYLAAETIGLLTAKGYEITIKDLYKERFNPVLTREERESYYGKAFDCRFKMLSLYKSERIRPSKAARFVKKIKASF